MGGGGRLREAQVTCKLTRSQRWACFRLSSGRKSASARSDHGDEVLASAVAREWGFDSDEEEEELDSGTLSFAPSE